MAVKTKAQLQADIDSLITTNGTGAITGAILNSILEDYKDSYQDYINLYTTVQRDDLAALPTPYIIYNTDNERFEYYNGSDWQGIGKTRNESPLFIKAEGNTDLTADESDDFRIIVGSGVLTIQKYNGASWVNIQSFS